MTIPSLDVMEASRYAIDKDHRHGAGVYLELSLGMIEYSLAEGISGNLALMRALKIPQLLNVGLKVRPLGLSREIGGENNTAVFYAMDEELLNRVRKSPGVIGSVVEGSRWARVA